MLYISRFLLFLMNIDQKMVLNWFGIEDPISREIREAIQNGFDPDIYVSKMDHVQNISFETFRLIFSGLWENLENGLTLSDIEDALFFILFIRFIILIFRYNLKTSFLITLYGFIAAFIWYKHLVGLTVEYRNMLFHLPFLSSLGKDATQEMAKDENYIDTEYMLGKSDVHWYNVGKTLYYAFTKAILRTDLDNPYANNAKYFMDPLSMLISILPESLKSFILPIYYTIYNELIPKVYEVITEYWKQLSVVLAYTILTRIGKKFCPYLIRWHWTFVLIIKSPEYAFTLLIRRMQHFHEYVLTPKLIESSGEMANSGLVFQVDFLRILINSLVLGHLVLVILALFHAVWGQYFYCPFFVENVELQVGDQPLKSIYRGGGMAWQDDRAPEIWDNDFGFFGSPPKAAKNPTFPKLWWGLFGRGTDKPLFDVGLFIFSTKLRFKKLFRKKKRKK